MRRTFWMVFVALMTVALSGCAGLAPQAATAANGKQGASAQPTATVQRGNLTATVNAAGNITAHKQVALNFGQAGTVQKVNVRAGDRVKAGQVLDRAGHQRPPAPTRERQGQPEDRREQTGADQSPNHRARHRQCALSLGINAGQLQQADSRPDQDRSGCISGCCRQRPGILRGGGEIGGCFRHDDRCGDGAVSESRSPRCSRRKLPMTKWPPRPISALGRNPSRFRAPRSTTTRPRPTTRHRWPRPDRMPRPKVAQALSSASAGAGESGEAAGQ